MIIIVSMHRSGSSLLGGLLAEAGLNFGNEENLVAPSSDNEKGFWERKDVVEFNESIISDGFYDHSFPKVENPIINQRKIDSLKAEMYVEGVEIVKDPRICLTLPIWLKAYPEAKIILLFRDPIQVALSLKKRQSMPLELGVSLWEFYYRQAIKEIKSENIFSLSFDKLVKNTESQIKEVLDFLGVEIDRKQISTNFLEKKLINNFSENNQYKKILTYEQKKLLESMEKGEFINVDLNLTPETKKIFSVMKQFVQIGYVPRSGVMAGSSIKQQNKQLQQSKEFLSNTINETRKFYKQELKGVHRELAETKKMKQRLEENETRLEENEARLEENEARLEENEARLTQKNIELSHHNKRLEIESRSYKELLRKIYRKNVKDFYKIKNGLFDFMCLSLFIRRIKTKIMQFRAYSSINGFVPAVAKAGILVLSGARKKFNFGNLKGLHKKWQKKKAKGLLVESFRELDEGVYNLPTSKTELIAKSFCIDFYSIEAEKNFKNDTEALKHFLTEGIKKGYSPHPMFDKEHYLRILHKQGAVCDSSAYEHWLFYGIENKIVPTELFDEKYFQHRYGKYVKQGEWGYLRFITLSVYNNCSPNIYFEPNWYKEHHQTTFTKLPAFYHYLLVGASKGWRPSPLFPCFSRKQCKEMDISPLQYVINKTGSKAIQARLEGDSKIQEIVMKASSYAPDILKPSGYRRINIPPYNNPLYPAIREIKDNLNRSNYDNIVIIPHCRYGGAGKVAGVLCETLNKIMPNSHTLLLRTDNDDFMRPDWFPKQVEHLNLLDFAPDLPDIHRKKLLLDILIGTKPKNIFNVHSRLGWIVFSEYGDRLKDWSSLFGYTFCYDLDITGKKVGYPVTYIPSSIENLKTLIVDNNYLKNDLIKVNKWDARQSLKIKVLNTARPKEEGANWQSPKRDIDEPKKVYWAGRFDRQKRFDLVIKIAKRRPDLEFWVWGKAMLGKELDESNIPANIKLQGLYSNFADLPISECDVWLYTSQWDGVPTILLDVGARGIPLVSTNVWGISDLISEENSWPVNDVLNVNHYIKGIDYFLENIDEANERGLKLKKIVESRYSNEKYQQELESLIVDSKV